MKATLKTFTALTVVLALSGEAGAQSNFSPMMKPNLTNLAKPNFVKPPLIISNGVKPINPNAVKPIVRPQVVRPAVTPRADVSRLAKKPDAQNRKKAERQARKQTPAKQAGTPIASIRELPPLPRSKPDRQVIAELPPLPRPKPISDAGPQPEPPSLEASARTSGLPGSGPGAPGQANGDPGLEGLRGHIDHLAMWQDLRRFRDLQELLEGNSAIGASDLGEGAGTNRQDGPPLPGGDDSGRRDGPGTPLDWREDQAGPSFGNAGPGTNDPHNREGSSGDGFERPGYSSPAGRYGPQSAGVGVQGRDGRTSQDGESSQDHTGNEGWDKTVIGSEDGGTNTITIDNEEDGSGYARYETHDADGNWQRTDTHYRTRYGATRVISDFSNGTSFQEDRNGQGEVIKRVWRSPDSQPNPDPNAGGEAGGWCTGHGDCVSPSDVTLHDKVAQPGGEGGEAGVWRGDGDRKSVAERTGVVTNPVDPANYVRTGGGGSRRPMEWVTEPGGGQ